MATESVHIKRIAQHLISTAVAGQAAEVQRDLQILLGDPLLDAPALEAAHRAQQLNQVTALRISGEPDARVGTDRAFQLHTCRQA